MNNWDDYNRKLIKKSIELINENKQSIFNSEEKRCYSHIRDLVALTLININKKNLKVLDYGSNIMPWSNIQNKIDLSNLSVLIFDPFTDSDYSSSIDFGFPICVENDSNIIHSTNFDIVLFGSSSQYIENFYEKLINNEIQLPKKVFFLDTPFSLSKDLNLNQEDQSKREYKVFIRSYSRLISIMEEKGYKLKFKSSLPWETQEFLNRSLFSKVKILNLLFEK